jgi:peptidoglycan/xylan/chitin deacetylase (PgdA/CDA1 family)
VNSHMDRRKLLVGAGLVTAGAAAGAAASFPVQKAEAAPGPTARTAVPDGSGTFQTTVTFRTTVDTKLIALTIDDGPTREWTPAMLALLRRHGAKATFFRVGERAQAAPGLVEQTAAEGHEQGNHTWAHHDLTTGSQVADRSSLERTHELLTRLTGQAPVLCRPPYGRIDSVGLDVCAGMRYGVALWSHHITGSNPSGGVNLILGHATPGSIVLAHDGGPEPNTALIRQLDRLVGSMMDEGYRFVTVSELLTGPPA